MKAFLILEDGTVMTGESFGSTREVVSEIVFNTSMTGYLEILTDPSYAGQSVVMTYPLIGNYGICMEDMEAEHPWTSGLIVREYSALASNFRSEMTLDTYLKKYDIPGIAGIDTRHLTRISREHGVMNGLITTREDFDLQEELKKIRAYKVTGVVREVSCKEKRVLPGDGFKVALMDYGAKRNIEKSLNQLGCQVSVYPAYTKAEDVLADEPDGIMLSNGPGDPEECVEIIEELKKLFATDIPIFGICLGHQLMALANGAKTKKMRYGHRGANHPVRDLRTGKVYISSQNHGYVVIEDTLDREIAEVSFVNVNDGTLEGVHYLGKNVMTVQFHPEACPGPNDSAFLFKEFIHMMEVAKDA